MSAPIGGVGIGLRGPHVADLLASDRGGSHRVVDFLEIIPENYVFRGGRDRRTLMACRERWPMLVHGVSLSLGGPDPFDDTYLASLKALLDVLRAPFYTDHLCFSSVGGFQSHELLPLPECEEAVQHVARRIRELADRLERPVAVENISQYAVMPGAHMGRAAFVAAVCEEADCGLLLDVNNLYVNARNFGCEPLAELSALPLHRVVQLHVAGHEVRHGRYIDHHGAPVCPEVLALTAEVLRRTGPSVPVLLERDLNLPPLDEVLDEADALRELLSLSVRGAA
jgi:uncharacterized protein (UPF0276 family)